MSVPSAPGLLEVGRRYRLHPATPLIHAAPVLPITGLVLFLSPALSFVQGLWLTIATAVVMAVGLTMIVGGLAYWSWTRFEFWLDEVGDLRVDSGILTRNLKKLQLSRLQSVQVVQPFIARIFGFATVTIEVAGIGDSRAALAYVKRDRAYAIRDQVIAISSGGTFVSYGATSSATDPTDAPSEHTLCKVPPGRLLGSLVLRSSTMALLILTVALIVFSYLRGGWQELFLVPITGGLPILIVVGEFIALFSFLVARSPNGVRVTYGMLQTQTQNVPPGRVHAIEFVQSFLWRKPGWVRVKMTVAGSASQQGDSNFGAVLLPVAPWPEAVALVRQLMPGIDESLGNLRGVGDSVRWRAPLQKGYLGVGLGESYFTARRGWITRRIVVVPHARVQSVRVGQGPWSRSLGLANVWVDVVPGPIEAVAPYRSQSEAQELAARELGLSVAARRIDRSTRWQSGQRAPDSDGDSDSEV